MSKISSESPLHYKEDYEEHDFSNKDHNKLNVMLSNLYSTNWYQSKVSDSTFKSCNMQYSKWSNTDIKDSKIKKCDFRGAEFNDSCLKSVDLSGSIFWECSLTNTVLEDVYMMDVVGNGREIKSFQIGLYTITYTWQDLQVGCKIHPIGKWDTFTNRDLLEMGGREASKFWMLHKELILSTIELSPAIKPNIK